MLIHIPPYLRNAFETKIEELKREIEELKREDKTQEIEKERRVKELKKEAQKYGYTLSKKIVYEKLKTCSCGNSRRIQQELSIDPKGKYYRCCNCGRKGELANSWYQARINWNKTLDKHDC